MFRRRGDNLHSIFVFLFLTVALYLLEHQDPTRFATLFAFDGPSVAAGEWWRVLTYQFTQSGQGWAFIPKPVFLFFTLLILYYMGSAIEEEWGTWHFLAFFTISSVVTAGLAGWLGVALLGSYFVSYTLLFVYASAFPDQTFYLFAVLPVRVRWLGYLTLGVLLYGSLFGSTSNVAVLGGAAAGYAYYLLHRLPVGRVIRKAAAAAVAQRAPSQDGIAERNAARWAAMREALSAADERDLDTISSECEREVVANVNICPPADYKPDAADGYCLRCEGFAECSARYIRLNRVGPSTMSGKSA